MYRTKDHCTHAEMAGDYHSPARVHLSSKDHEEQGHYEVPEYDFVGLLRLLELQLQKLLE